MSENYQSLIPEIEKRFKQDFWQENNADTNELLGLPYPYTVSGKDSRQALFYWDTFFINQALLHFKMIDEARHNVENLIFLFRKLNFIPTSNHKTLPNYVQPPLLPWMIRDIYRATGDKEWLRRVLPEAIKEFNIWTTKPHTSPTGLYRYSKKYIPADTEQEPETAKQYNLICSQRFKNVDSINPVDLNAILYRNAKLLYDLQIEINGHGDDILLQKSDHIKNIMDMFWDEKESFYFDNDLENKQLIKVKTLSGFMPLFVEMIDKSRAKALTAQIKHFVGPGGLSFTDKDYSSNIPALKYPLITAPCIYFIIKGLCDYEFMEDAADIGTSWLDMVFEIYQSTGEMWEWYNIQDKSVKTSNGIPNTPVWGWTAGTFIALIDALGLR